MRPCESNLTATSEKDSDEPGLSTNDNCLDALRWSTFHGTHNASRPMSFITTSPSLN